jgi:NhaP-type Na+/H+ or K+/H+ antiporter
VTSSTSDTISCLHTTIPGAISPLADSLRLAAESAAQHAALETIVISVAAGVGLIVIAHKLGLPAIVLLLLGGFLLGPEVFGVVQPNELGETGLRVLVAVAIGIILFEGGLTLDLSGYREASSVIKRLLSIGVIVTWLLTAAGIYGVFALLHPERALDPRVAVIAGSLVIVTGPTVIAPLLKRVRLKQRVRSVLHWEGVLIDPIGVFIAVLCFEWVAGGSGQAALTNLAMRVIVGLAIGTAGGFILLQLFRHKFIPEDLLNVGALAFALVVFGAADLAYSEAGLLSVAVAGFIVGAGRPAHLRQMRAFKAELTELLIGSLFILLSARLELAQFSTFGWGGFLSVVLVIFVVRPISVWICTAGLDFPWQERAFLSWVAPRGIVAASMASLVALSLEGQVENPRFVETFTYSVIVATIVLQGFSAAPLAGLLGLRTPPPTGWMIVGAHAFARRIGRFLEKTTDVSVVFVDSNRKAIAEAKQEGANALLGDARDTKLATNPAMSGVGNLLALTDNEDLNMLLCQRWAISLGRDHVFRWGTPAGTGDSDSGDGQPDADRPGTVVWSTLPKPSLLSSEMLRSEAIMLEHQHGNEDSQSLFMTPMLAINQGGKIQILDAQAASNEDGQKPAIDPEKVEYVLYLRREADYLVRSLHPHLLTRVDVESKEQLFELLIDRIVQVVPQPFQGTGCF